MVDVDENGDPHVLVDALEIIHHLFGGDGVQRSHRLVGQDDLWILRQCAGQRDTLLLAAGELVCTDKGLVQNADLVQRFQRGCLFRFGKDAESCTPPGKLRHKGGEYILMTVVRVTRLKD